MTNDVAHTPPTSAPLMQRLASAVAVCAISRSAAVIAEYELHGCAPYSDAFLNETRWRVPARLMIEFFCSWFRNARSTAIQSTRRNPAQRLRPTLSLILRIGRASSARSDALVMASEQSRR